ncbi:MAG: exodeoxyribonuclease VII small subunit [Propionibacteriaceae bacterium]|jgi:exodeoxyribonuclease VII small subunit|nr:exodeoxyribonuclease VII small subunit [Propionibacteriaceae bacterium]
MAARKTTAPTSESAPTPDESETQTPELTYEQARDQLIEVVATLESGGESLADSLELYKKGERLAALCEKYLTQARETVENAQAVG